MAVYWFLSYKWTTDWQSRTSVLSTLILASVAKPNLTTTAKVWLIDSQVSNIDGCVISISFSLCFFTFWTLAMKPFISLFFLMALSSASDVKVYNTGEKEHPCLTCLSSLNTSDGYPLVHIWLYVLVYKDSNHWTNDVQNPNFWRNTVYLVIARWLRIASSEKIYVHPEGRHKLPLGA